MSKSVVWIVAGIHGDETGAVATAKKFARDLARMKINRTIYILPIANPEAAKTKKRELRNGEDLNRHFPGKRTGSPAARLARQVFDRIVATKPNLVIDLHNDWRRSVPYAIIDPRQVAKSATVYRQALKAAKAAGLPVIVEPAGEATTLKKTLSGSLMRAGWPALTLELGGAGTIKKQDMAVGVKAIKNILGGKIKTNRLLNYSDRPRSRLAGRVKHLVRPGVVVKAGTVLATASPAYGRVQIIRAPRRALILGLTDKKIIRSGEPVVALGLY